MSNLSESASFQQAAMSYTAMSPEQLLKLYELSSKDLELIKEYGKIIMPRMDEYVESLYAWMRRLPEYQQFFSDEKRLAHVQKMQVEYWKDFFEAEINASYIAKRRIVGESHARINLPLPTYLASMNVSMKLLGETMYDDSMPDRTYANAVRAMTKLIHLDTSIVVDAFSAHVSRIIAEQSQTLLEMSTPVTAIWDGILMLPIVGIIDSKRAQDIMNAMLSMIAETKAKVFILDISGVAVVDTAVANHLIKITKATKLMGCECTISGVSPAIAQTVVELGVDVGDVSTTANLRDALTYAFRRTGVEIRTAH